MDFTFMLYPTFEFDKSRGCFLPNVRLPRNYRELVPEFYKRGGEQYIESYKKIVQREILRDRLGIQLRWDEIEGLRNIGIGPSGGFDLDTQPGWPNFREHNLGTQTSLAASMVATEYILALLKSG